MPEFSKQLFLFQALNKILKKNKGEFLVKNLNFTKYLNQSKNKNTQFLNKINKSTVFFIRIFQERLE